jgi:hypothetical protein
MRQFDLHHNVAEAEATENATIQIILSLPQRWPVETKPPFFLCPSGAQHRKQEDP